MKKSKFSVLGAFVILMVCTKMETKNDLNKLCLINLNLQKINAFLQSFQPDAIATLQSPSYVALNLTPQISEQPLVCSIKNMNTLC